MSFSSRLKKISNFLSETFNTANVFPEPEIRTEMEKEGWRFDVHHAFHPYMVYTINVISTPEGKLVGGDPEMRTRYEETVAQKKAKLQPLGPESALK